MLVLFTYIYSKNVFSFLNIIAICIICYIIFLIKLLCTFRGKQFSTRLCIYYTLCMHVVSQTNTMERVSIEYPTGSLSSVFSKDVIVYLNFQIVFCYDMKFFNFLLRKFC